MATLKEYFTPTTSDDYQSLRRTNKCQTFVAESTHTVNQIKLKLRKSTDAPHTLFGIYLYAVDGSHLPTGSALVQMGSFYNDELTTSYVIYTFEDSSYEITNGVEYAIVIYTSTQTISTYLWWWTNIITDYSTGFPGWHNYTTIWTANDATYDRWFEIYESAAVPSKPINPTPVNDATEVDFSGFTLSWENGGGATSYDVWVGPSESLAKVSSSQAGISYVTNINEVPYNQKIYWRIDAINASGTTTGDTWNFDARPGPAVTPYPGNAASGITLDDTTATWETGVNTTAFDVYFRPFGEFYALVGSDITDLFCVLRETNYQYGWLYFWAVVSKNQFGTYPANAPDGFLADYEWYFNAMVFRSPKPSGATDWNEEGGYWEGTLIGANNMITVKRLVGVAANKFWFEEI